MTYKEELSDQGYIILSNYFEKDFVDRLIRDLDQWMTISDNIRKRNGLGDVMAGVAHQILGRDDSMADLIRMLPWDSTLKDYFHGPYILNSLSGVKNIPNDQNAYEHVRTFHRDVRTYSGKFKLMINVLIMLEDFTVANGATEVIPGSHNNKNRPEQSELEQNAKTLLGSAGTAVLFDSNVWHCAAPSIDQSPRRAVTITYSRPFMKQQIDFCKLVGPDFSPNPEVMQVIGFRSRVPESHSDWYQPSQDRFYHSDQG